MTHRVKWLIIALISALALGGTASVGIVAWHRYQDRTHAMSAASIAADADWADGARVVFRNTAQGDGYGIIASVPLSDPSGARALGPVACDRVAASGTELSCLRSERGITPTYTARVLTETGETTTSWPLPGVPSRTRFSPDGTLVATTAFVTGHAYAALGFSTSTTIHSLDGKDVGGDLEDWTLLLDGKRSAPVDRNYWGITFVDDTTFYATVGMTTKGITYLVKGDLATRTFTSVASTVECPSLSPDGKRIAFKRVTDGSGATVHWTPAVLDLSSGKVTVLERETRSIDDQIVWLDDRTLLYGAPNETPGDTDVWSLAADGSAGPKMYIQHAWSPTIVRR